MNTQPTTRTFHCTEAGSSKFWTIVTATDGKSFTVIFGKIGTAGQSKEKSFPTADACAKEAAKLIREKTGKGYIEQNTTASPTSQSTTVTQAGTPASPVATPIAPTASAKPAAPKKSPKPVAPLPPYNANDPKQQRAFLRTVRSGNLDKIRAYIDSGATLYKCIKEGRMIYTFPFDAALENPQPEIIRYFISLCATDRRTHGHGCVLSSIAKKENVSDDARLAAVQMLLDCGYDCSRDDFMLEHLPDYILPEDLVRKLYNLASRARDTGEPICNALRYGGNIACRWITTPWKPDPMSRLIWMLEHGLNPNFAPTEHNKHERDAYGTTLHVVLRLASRHPACQALIEKLLEKGADPCAKDKSGLTPWEYAEVSDREIPANIITRLRKAAEAAAKK